MSEHTNYIYLVVGDKQSLLDISPWLNFEMFYAHKIKIFFHSINPNFRAINQISV